MVLRRIISKFFKLDEKKALQVEFHPVGSNTKKGPRKWLLEEQLSEIKDLLHDVIQKCMTDKEKTEKKTEKSSQIITGSTVKIGYVFKKKSKFNDLLLGDDTDDESPSRSLYGLKLIVYVCPIEPGSPDCGIELHRAMTRSESGGKMMKISSYFSKTEGSQGQSTNGVSSSSTSTSTSSSSTSYAKSCPSSATSVSTSSSTSSSASSSQDHKDVIRNIMKRGKMSKHSKKKKSEAENKDTDTTFKQNYTVKTKRDSATNTLKGKKTSQCGGSTSPQTSASVDTKCTEGNLAILDSCGANNKHKTKKNDTKHKTKENDTNKKNIMAANISGESLPTPHDEEDKGISGRSALGTITLCHTSSSLDCFPSTEPSITVYSAEQVQELNLLDQTSDCDINVTTVHSPSHSIPTSSDIVLSPSIPNPADIAPSHSIPNPADIAPSPSIPTPMDVPPSPSDSINDDSNDSVLPSYSFIQQKTDGGSVCEDNGELDSDIDTDPLFHHYDDVCVNNIGFSNSDSSGDEDVSSKAWRSESPGTEYRRQDNIQPHNSSVNDSDSTVCLMALKQRLSRKRLLPNFPDDTKSDEEVSPKSQKTAKETKCEPPGESGSVQTASISPPIDDLPLLKRCKYVCRSPRKFKQATLTLQGGNLSVKKNQSLQSSQKDDDDVDFMMLEDEESKQLRSDLRREIIHAENVRDLNEQHVWYLVKENKRYLKDIFEGKTSCERHKQYKEGGRTRYRLNYQIYLSLFTDEQQDVVMEALMSIFCKKNHGFLDYVMKVLLPEMLIKIYMEVTGLDHGEVEEIMAGGNT